MTVIPCKIPSVGSRIIFPALAREGIKTADPFQLSIIRNIVYRNHHLENVLCAQLQFFVWCFMLFRMFALCPAQYGHTVGLNKYFGRERFVTSYHLSCLLSLRR